LKPQLIVTADDVGLHRGMNAGAVEAHRRGIVTACSVVANGAAFEDAVSRLRECPDLDTGLHLTLVEERPVEPAAAVPSLVGANGRFPKSFRGFVARYAVGRIHLRDVERELAAQIEKALAAGLRPVHLNGHQHLHVLPAVFEAVLRLAELYGIPYVRTPLDVRRGLASPVRRASIGVLNRFGLSARRAAREAGVFTSDRTVGIAEAGHLTTSILLTVMDRAEGLTELVCHPGLGGDEIARAYDWGYFWDRETAALCDPKVRETLIARGIELIGVTEAVS
jgi:chitin disaccharide deacetylase